MSVTKAAILLAIFLIGASVGRSDGQQQVSPEGQPKSQESKTNLRAATEDKQQTGQHTEQQQQQQQQVVEPDEPGPDNQQQNQEQLPQGPNEVQPPTNTDDKPRGGQEPQQEQQPPPPPRQPQPPPPLTQPDKVPLPAQDIGQQQQPNKDETTTTTTTLKPKLEPTREKYAVVVDCGSTGSRAHIYHWPANASRHELASAIRALRDTTTDRAISMSIRPGLSVVRDQPDKASDYMKPLMKFASENVPKEVQPETAVYFLGTAGMRLLSDHEQAAILDDIGRDVKHDYHFGEIHTEVVSGRSEGAYRWLSCNSASNRLNRSYDQKQDIHFYFQSAASRRYGIVEMGGASAQVSFEVTPKMDEFISSSLTPFSDALQVYRQSRVLFERVKSNNGTYGRARQSTGGGGSGAAGDEQDQEQDHFEPVALFSATFLGFGSDGARQLAVDLLVRDAIRMPSAQNPFGVPFAALAYSAQSTLVVADPCLPVGAEDALQKPVELLYGQQKTIGYYVRPGEATFTVRLVGRGNYLLCYQLLTRMILLAKQEQTNCQSWTGSGGGGGGGGGDGQQRKNTPKQTPCVSSLIRAPFVPWLQLQFLGLAELYHSTHSTMQTPGRFNLPLVQFNSIGQCSMTLTALRAQYPLADQVDKRRTLLQCFKVTWLLVWLQTGLLMPPSQLAHLETLDERLNGAELDWTLGALIEKQSLEETN